MQLNLTQAYNSAPPWPTFLQESCSREKGPILVWRNRATCHFRGKPSSGDLLCSHPWIGRPVDQCCLGLSRKRLLTSNHWENAIRSTLVPAMLSRVASNNTEWELLTLPSRLGWLWLPCLSRMAQCEFDISVSLMTPLTSLSHWSRSPRYGSVPGTAAAAQGGRPSWEKRQSSSFRQKYCGAVAAQAQRAVQLQERKAHHPWLNALPMVEHGFDLSDLKPLSLTQSRCIIGGKARTCCQHVHVEWILTLHTHSSAQAVA